MASHVNKPHVCPWWVGYFLISPLRRFIQDPESILAPYVKEGMTVLEIGPGMGYFSLPLARLVGEKGKVLCVDIQKRMLERLMKRAAKAGIADRITTVLASEYSLHLDAYPGAADFALAFAVVHEVPDQSRLFEETYRVMKPASLLCLSEPKGHVEEEDFKKTIELAKANGFKVDSPINIKRSLSMILKK